MEANGSGRFEETPLQRCEALGFAPRSAPFVGLAGWFLEPVAESRH